LYVQACPGAGKTRIIVERHLAEAHGARGRAVLSFTNIACEEVMRRCREAGKPELAAFPHYVGTIDTFLWRYLVRPFLKPGRQWHRIDSWDRIDAYAEVGTGTNRHRVFLNDFQWSREPDADECTAQLQRKKRSIKSYNALVKQNKLEAAALAAILKRNDLAGKGYITGHEIRIMALRTLRQRQADPAPWARTRFQFRLQFQQRRGVAGSRLGDGERGRR
jgi:DNA helicase-2/ATP-dependent DNA helicase PcrA